MKSGLVDRNSDNDDWATRWNGYAVSFFDGVVAENVEDAVVGDTVITFTKDNDGITGGGWEASSGGILNRLSTDVMRGTALKTATAMFGRMHKIGEDPKTASAVLLRRQGLIGVDFFVSSAAFTLGVDSDLGNVTRTRPVGV